MTTPATAKSPPLSDYLCFAVYSANLAFGRAYRPVLEPLGLTYTQYVTLVALWEQDDQTVGSLGEKLFLESNTLTPILKKLEQTGFVERRRDPADERQVRIRLTAKGRDLQNECIGDKLIEATGLGDDFVRVQKAITNLRDNLLASTAP
ncbi:MULTISPECIES: MarR family transcriptional regulator [unclassified Sphingopyxis]|uniref:MarR family winged helix-turn-helix transcriptional regulator n=1 Tax=unclassified Sphingopyxis TaxID=2614943 RepID=UPI0024AE4F8E|nr:MULTISPECIES: MarR family transcriptional regulator [unclassified Sphingopyxis]